jgi:hypothetical protein
LNAANGTTIAVLGEIDTILELGSLQISVTCLVSEHVDEILLGLTFLEQNACVWDFAKRNISIGGMQFKLIAHKPTYGVRRVVLQDDTRIQPRCQQAVLAKTVYSSLAQLTVNWATKPMELAAGVYLARAMVVDRPVDVPLQVINTTNPEVHLEKGLHLGGLEEVQPVQTSSFPMVEHSGDIEHLRDVIDGVDTSATGNDKAE